MYTYRKSLRDEFAMAALQGLCANSEEGQIVKSDGATCVSMEDVQARFAELAYQYADAMLKAREVKP